MEEGMVGPTLVRDIERLPGGVEPSDTKPLNYQKLRKNFRNLGRGLGMRKLPEWYDLRRGGGTLITGKMSFLKLDNVPNQVSRSIYR